MVEIEIQIIASVRARGTGLHSAQIFLYQNGDSISNLELCITQ
jgi:hypothetical protein